jgi:hypothetical protein
MRARIVLALLALATLAGPRLSVARSGGTWGADQRLTSDRGRSFTTYNFARDVAADSQGRVHAVWYDDRGGSFQIYTRRSVDRGATWGADLLLSPGFAAAEHPAVAASGSTVLVVWHGQRAGANGPDVYLRRSSDGGRSWGAVLPLTESHAAAHAAVALFGRSAQVVWGESGSGTTEIATRHSRDGGKTWTEAQPVSAGDGEASWVSTVALEGDEVHVAWVDTRDGNEEEYYRRSIDGGESWEPVLRLTRNPANSWAPSLTVAGGRVHLVWFDQKDSAIQPRAAEGRLDGILRDLGLPVLPEPAGVLVPHPEEEARRRAQEKAALISAAAPDWVRAGGDATRLQAILNEVQALGAAGASYLVKDRKLDEALQLMGLTYTLHPFAGVPRIDHGEALQIRVADKLGEVRDAAPDWVRRGGDPAALEARLRDFEQSLDLATQSWEIYYRRSDDGGRTWGAAQRLTRAAGVSARPSVVVAGSDVDVAWFDERDGDFEIYAKHSADGGETWGEDVRLTRAPGASMLVSLAAAGGDLYALWYDERDGNPEIYFKRRAK